MKAIILAAGKGKRMGSKTDDIPKCMIYYNGKPIIDYTLDTLDRCGIDDIIIVTGYKSEVLESYLKDRDIQFIRNKYFDITNMVKTLFCAESEMNDNIIVSYSDIIFKKRVLLSLMNNEEDFVVTIDKKWRNLWDLRMDDPLKDAETLKIDDGYILEIGEKPLSFDDIEGQYIGLFKISDIILGRVKNFYHNLDKSKSYDGNNFNNMYMTSFLQLIIDHLMPIKADLIEGGWLEFDTEEDLEVYTNDNIII